MVITIFQEDYIKTLYKDLGQEVEIGLENLSKKEAHELIQELLELKNKIR